MSKSGRSKYLPPLRTVLAAYPFGLFFNHDAIWPNDPIRDKPLAERVRSGVERNRDALSAHGFGKVETRDHQAFILRSVTEGRFAATSFMYDSITGSNMFRWLVIPVAAAAAALLAFAVPSLATFATFAAIAASTGTVGAAAIGNFASRYRGLSEPLRDFERRLSIHADARVWRVRTLGSSSLEKLRPTIEGLIEAADRTLLPVSITYVCRDEAEANLLRSEFGFRSSDTKHGKRPVVFRGVKGHTDWVERTLYPMRSILKAFDREAVRLPQVAEATLEVGEPSQHRVDRATVDRPHSSGTTLEGNGTPGL